MLEPDIRYYVRAIRTRWRFLIVGGLVGAALGVLLSLVPGRDGGWVARQRVVMTSADSFLNPPELPALRLPEREPTAEAGYLTVLIRNMELHKDVTAIADTTSDTVKIRAGGSSRAVASSRLRSVADRYVSERREDYDAYFEVLADTLGAQRESLDDSLAELDATIASIPTTETVAAQAVLAERAATARRLQSVDAAVRTVRSLRTSQSGGIELASGQVEHDGWASRSWPLVVALTVVGVAIGAIAALVHRSARRTIESPQDLELFPSLITLGSIGSVSTDLAEKLTASEGGPPRPIVVTESLFGQQGSVLVERLRELGVDAERRACRRLADAPSDESTNQTVVLAVDRDHDTERTVLDVVGMLQGGAPRTLYAIFC